MTDPPLDPHPEPVTSAALDDGWPRDPLRLAFDTVQTVALVVIAIALIVIA